jgi:hypothetical protein
MYKRLGTGLPDPDFFIFLLVVYDAHCHKLRKVQHCFFAN